MLIYFSTYLFSSGSEHIPSGTPEIVIVTVLDEATMSNEYKERIKENRIYYAKKQGVRHMNRTLIHLNLTEAANRLCHVLSRGRRL